MDYLEGQKSVDQDESKYIKVCKTCKAEYRGKPHCKVSSALTKVLQTGQNFQTNRNHKCFNAS